MTNAESDELEGNTLNVYAFVVKEGKPVGPREVMRGANLSSPALLIGNCKSSNHWD